MKLTKTKLKQIIKEELKNLTEEGEWEEEEEEGELEDWEPPEGEYKEGSFIEVQILDDGYSVDIVEEPEKWVDVHQGYGRTERFLAQIVKTSTQEFED